MGKRIFFGGLLVILAACGGRLDTDAPPSDPLPAPPRDGEQGLYFPPPDGEEPLVADRLGTRSAERVVITTRKAIVGGLSVDGGP